MNDAEEILWFNIGDDNSKLKAALWLTAESVSFCLHNFGEGTVDDFKCRMRESRWNAKGLFKKHFKHFLNIF